MSGGQAGSGAAALAGGRLLDAALPTANRVSLRESSVATEMTEQLAGKMSTAGAPVRTFNKVDTVTTNSHITN